MFSQLYVYSKFTQATRVAGWKHAVLHCLRFHMESILVEVLDWAEEMERVRAALSLSPASSPAHPHSASHSTERRCSSGVSCSISPVTLSSTLPTSTADSHRSTISSAVIEKYRRYRRLSRRYRTGRGYRHQLQHKRTEPIHPLSNSGGSRVT